MTSRIKRAYTAVERLTGAEYLEPLRHVERVNELRWQFRPKTVRLLIIGESHVRRSDGPGFLYDASYYTPWWRDLLWPAFGGREQSREDNLRALQERGVWVLDASIVALSGYRNVDREWPARPLDPHRHAIFKASWDLLVQHEFESAQCANVVYFACAASVLPARTQSNGTALRFNGPRNPKALRYTDPAYRFGTARFVEAVRAAGL